jgi:hypothetical protein
VNTRLELLDESCTLSKKRLFHARLYRSSPSNPLHTQHRLHQHQLNLTIERRSRCGTSPRTIIVDHPIAVPEEELTGRSLAVNRRRCFDPNPKSHFTTRHVDNQTTKMKQPLQKHVLLHQL